MMTDKTDKTDTVKSEKENGNLKRNRDFERHGVYTPRDSNIHYQYGADRNSYNNYNYDYKNENKFRFKNSLVITPFYEIEFNASGGIKYIKNHDDCVLFTNDGIFAETNNIQKIPVLIKRGLKKHPVQKKLIVEEKYNYEEKYDIYKNVILYYEENRLDFQILFNKSNADQNTKDITTEFSLNLSVPEIDHEITYKKYDSKQEYKSSLSNMHGNQDNHGGAQSNNFNNLEYITVKHRNNRESYMTLYSDKRQLMRYRDRTLSFAVPNISQAQKNYINLKVYLEKYRVT